MLPVLGQAMTKQVCEGVLLPNLGWRDVGEKDEGDGFLGRPRGASPVILHLAWATEQAMQTE